MRGVDRRKAFIVQGDAIELSVPLLYQLWHGNHRLVTVGPPSQRTLANGIHVLAAQPRRYQRL